MPCAGFVHLRVHSAYSLSQGACRIPQLVQAAHTMHMPALGIADTSNLFGALEFSQTCWKQGIQPIIGCQLNLNTGGSKDRFGRFAYDPVVLLAQNQSGLQNLQYLSSRGFLDHDGTDEPFIHIDTLLAHAEGLFLLTGGTRGPLFRLLAEGQMAEARNLLEMLARAFPDRVGVELHRHGVFSERSVEPGMVALADTMGLPLVATNECFFLTPDMYEAHDALVCIAQGRTMEERDRFRVTAEHWFKPADMMQKLFADFPEACSNTLLIAQKCAVKAETRAPLLPVCPKVHDGADEQTTLRQMAEEGLSKRFEKAGIPVELHDTYRKRLAFELDVIADMGFSGYFLIVADFIQWAKHNGIPVGPGRGSGAGSLAAWALTITDIDPLPFNLLFERFLNPQRVSMPDFDIDFCQDRRDDVIEYVRQEYGADRVAQIITFGKLQARAAVRDVGRVLGLPFFMVNKVAELIPNNPANPVSLKQAVDTEPRLQDLRDTDESIRRLLEIAMQLEGLYRHASTHAAGIVIGDRDLVELVPLYKDQRSEMLVTQYNMKYVEQAGLVKFDFLGLATLTILQRSVRILEKLGIRVDISTIPLDDPLTYDMLSRGDTGGVFQFEGAGMRDVLRQMRPTRLEDLIAAVALYRPGPMANIPDYCRRKHGEPWAAPHESIRDILEETYGIMVYQEQVMQIAQKMAGYSLGAADLLRRAMGKKIRAEMDQQREIFTKGATERGIEPQKAAEVFDLMAKFADYGFNKSHAAAYALVSYQTAWMKANYPVPFFAACMSLAREKTEKLATLKQETERLGIKVLPPDINASEADFIVEVADDGTQAIRYALAAVKRVGLHAMESVVKARGDTPFKDLMDFTNRIDPKNLNKMQIESLAKAGAFDSIAPDRNLVFSSAEIILRRAHANMNEKNQGQAGLFNSQMAPEPLPLPDVRPWTEYDALSKEAEALGFHLTAHPLMSYRPLLKRMGVTPANQLEAAGQAGVTRVKLAGCVIDRKERPTRTGNKMAWVRLSDPTGSCEVTFFSEVLVRKREELVAGNAVLITADLRMDGEMLRVTAADCCSLDKAAIEAGSEIRISFKSEQPLRAIHDTLHEKKGGKGRVILMPIINSSQDIEVILPDYYEVTPRLVQEIKTINDIVRVEYN